MKKFLLKSGVLLLAIILFFSLLSVYVAAFMPPNPYHYMYAQKAKIDRLDTLPSPRLILIGGSNAAFGFDSPRIADALGVNVANTALHAGVGLKFMVDVVSVRTKPGDVIVIIPEYSQFRKGGPYFGTSETLASAVFYSGSDAWRLLNVNQIATVIGGMQKHILANVKAGKSQGWYYNSLNFNAEGDECAHWTVSAVMNEHPSVSPGMKLDARHIDDLAAKIRSLESRGCKVILLWPTTIESNYKLYKTLIEDIDKEFVARGLHFANSPRTFVHPDSLAFDTPYHMSRPAVTLNTDSIIALLRPHSPLPAPHFTL